MRSRAVLALVVRSAPAQQRWMSRRSVSMDASPLMEVLKVAGLAVAAPLGALYLGQRSLIYPRPPYAEDPKTYGGADAALVLVDVTREERPADAGDVLAGAWFPPPSPTSGVVLYFHGNADQVGWGPSELGAEFRARGVGFFAAEYPGYGFAESGAPSQASVFWAAERAAKHLADDLGVAEDRVTVVGQSLGCAPALHLVAERPGLSRVVCISPFASIADMAAAVFPFVPRAVAAFLAKDPYDNLAVARSIADAEEALVIHGAEDDIVPFAQGELVAETLAGSAFLPVAGAGHNDILGAPGVVDAVVAVAAAASRDAC